MYRARCVADIPLWLEGHQHEHILPGAVLQETLSQHSATRQVKKHRQVRGGNRGWDRGVVTGGWCKGVCTWVM